MSEMFKKILVANRGEIACRVFKTCSQMGIKTVAVFSDIDRNSLHVQMADEAFNIGPAEVQLSYLCIEKIIEACQVSGADAVHPGYGFLSENSNFCQSLADVGITFIGPPAAAIKSMGDKITSKQIALDAGVSTIPGFLGVVETPQDAARIANEIGYPVMIKASAGGGGKGMRIANGPNEVLQGFSASQNEAEKSFGDNRIFIEKFIDRPRHIEIQILGDTFGNYVFFGERECSIQRRNQKIIEEAPSLFITETIRKEMGEQAIALARMVGYCSAGTVEFIVDSEQKFYFLEMNTRLQVEHPVTELVYGVDLVREMVNVACNKPIPFLQKDIKIKGWAIESRVYAEDPTRNFLPSVGRLTRYLPPAEVNTKTGKLRNDSGVYEGAEISIYYDPLIAKLCVWASDRKLAIEKMREALDSFNIQGVQTNLAFLSAVMDNNKFESGDFSTAFIEEEYPNGFDYIVSDPKFSKYFAIMSACMEEIRSLSGRNSLFRGIKEKENQFVTRVLLINKIELTVHFKRIDAKTFIFKDKLSGKLTVNIDWSPGDSLVFAMIGKIKIKSKIDFYRGSFVFDYRGRRTTVQVYNSRDAELVRFMIDQQPQDVSKFIICPMPGLLVNLGVTVGDEVVIGQSLCTVEAMKMENVIKAEKNGVIKAVNKKVGDPLAVEDVILEFE